MTYNMTKVLIFADGSELNIDESSSITYITLTVNSFDEVQEVANKFTVENMKTLGIDTGVYTDVILETFMTRLQDDGSVFITIQNRTKTFEESVHDVLLEQSNALMELAEAIATDEEAISEMTE